VVDIIPNM